MTLGHKYLGVLELLEKVAGWWSGVRNPLEFSLDSSNAGASTVLTAIAAPGERYSVFLGDVAIDYDGPTGSSSPDAQSIVAVKAGTATIGTYSYQNRRPLTRPVAYRKVLPPNTPLIFTMGAATITGKLRVWADVVHND